MKREFDFTEERRELTSSLITIPNPSAPRKIRVRDSPTDHPVKSYLKGLHGWGFQDHSLLSIPKFSENSVSKRGNLFEQSELSPGTEIRSERVAKLANANSNLKKENEYLKKNFKEAKETLKESEDRISPLENIINELKDQLNDRTSS